MFKKLISLLIPALLFCTLLPTNVLAVEPTVKSKAVVLMDAHSGNVLFQKAGDEKNYPASTTKILTSIVALENGKLDDNLVVGKEIDGLSSGGSFVTGKLKIGEKVTLEDMLYGMMLTSGNDAACVVAAHYGETLENFSTMMNQKAKDIGMTNSRFVNPHGVHNDNHYTTAIDLAKLARYALSNKALMKAVGSAYYTIPANSKAPEGHELKTTNKLIGREEDDKQYNYIYATGMKTGSTPKAQACLVATAQKDGVTLIAVILGDPSSNGLNRWKEAKDLFEYGFSNLASLPLKSLTLTKKIEQQVSGASLDDSGKGMLELELVIGEEIITGLSSDIEAIKKAPAELEIVPAFERDLVAPIEKGDKVGTAAIKHNDTTLVIVDLVASRAVSGEVILNPTPTSSLLNNAQLSTNGKDKASGLLGGIIVAVLVLLFVVAVLLIIRKINSRKRFTRRKASRGRRMNSYNYKKR